MADFTLYERESGRRECKESPYQLGEDEIEANTITVPTSWGTTAFANLSAKLFEDPDNANVDKTATMLSGATTASGQVITTPKVTGLTAGKKYRLDVIWDSSEGDTLEAFAIIYAER